MLRVNNLIGFGARGAGALLDITIIDDGGFAPSSGIGTNTHTYTSRTASGPHSFALIAYTDASDLALTGATWGGSACSILVQSGDHGAGTLRPRAAIIGIAGAQTGNLVLSFAGTVDDSQITVVSLENLQSLIPVDTDSDNRVSSDSTACNLDNLLSPGAGGIRLAVMSHQDDASAMTWTNATEIDDIDAGSFRQSSAYALGDSASTISTNAANNQYRAIAGVSLR